MNNVLETLGVIPVSNSVLSSLFPETKNRNKKISRLEQSGDIIRLKRGLYVVSPRITGKPLSVELMANHIYPVSYVSCYSALRYYGLIPDQVFVTQSMTTKHSRTFINEFGRFEYIHISQAAFPIGVTQESNEEYSFLIATPEKALCDLITTQSMLNLRYLDEAYKYLSEDLRLNMEAFFEMRVEIFKQFAAAGKKSSSIKTIIKLIEKG